MQSNTIKYYWKRDATVAYKGNAMFVKEGEEVSADIAQFYPHLVTESKSVFYDEPIEILDETPVIELPEIEKEKEIIVEPESNKIEEPVIELPEIEKEKSGRGRKPSVK